jgi:hypothetical protein
MPVYESNRTFRVVRWNLGHSWLVLRTDPTTETPSTIEVSFKPVRALCIASSFDGIRIAPTEAEGDLLAATHVLGAAPDRFQTCFAVDSARAHGWVVCGAVHVLESEGEAPTVDLATGYRPDDKPMKLFEFRTALQ